MNNTSKVLIGVLVVALVAVSAYAFLSSSVGQPGAAGPGPTHYQAENFLQGFYAGTSGQYWTSSTGTVVANNLKIDARAKYQSLSAGGRLYLANALSTTTITAAQICANGVVTWTPGVAVASATLPNASDFRSACLPEIGDYKEIVWMSGSAAASTTAFTVGVSSTIKFSFASSTSQGTMIPGGKSMKLRFATVSTTASTANQLEILGTLFQ